MVRHALKYELLSMTRNRRRVLFPVAFPLLLLLVLSGTAGWVPAGERYICEPDDLAHALGDLADWAIRAGVSLDALEIVRPSLEDVYLELTGGAHHTTPEPSAPRRGRRSARR